MEGQLLVQCLQGALGSSTYKDKMWGQHSGGVVRTRRDGRGCHSTGDCGRLCRCPKLEKTVIGTLMSGGGWARKVRLRNLGVKIRQQSLMDGVSRWERESLKMTPQFLIWTCLCMEGLLTGSLEDWQSPSVCTGDGELGSHTSWDSQDGTTFRCAIDGMFGSTPKFLCYSLTPSVLEFGGGAFGRLYLGHAGGALFNKISTF